MALIARYLIDTSAAARMHVPAISAHLRPLIESGVVATCAVLDAEALYSARDPAEYEMVRSDRRLSFEYLPTDDEHWAAALSVQRQLAARGLHRAVGIGDLLIAVLAAQHTLTVLHYDGDFEIAASVLTFDHKWVVPRGSV